VAEGKAHDRCITDLLVAVVPVIAGMEVELYELRRDLEAQAESARARSARRFTPEPA
jgi:hypothetical protein